MIKFLKYLGPKICIVRRKTKFEGVYGFICNLKSRKWDNVVYRSEKLGTSASTRILISKNSFRNARLVDPVVLWQRKKGQGPNKDRMVPFLGHQGPATRWTLIRYIIEPAFEGLNWNFGEIFILVLNKLYCPVFSLTSMVKFSNIFCLKFYQKL